MNEPTEHFEVSASQLNFWLHSKLDKSGLASNMTFAFKLYGMLNAQHFEATIRYIVLRHEILRTNFKLADGQLRQFIKNGDTHEGYFAYQDATNSTQEESSFLQYFSQLKLDLATDPLFQARLFRLEENKYVFTFILHHILGDEWSLLIFQKELIAVYNRLVSGLEPGLPPLSLQYKDFAAWHNQKLLEDDHKLKSYWQQKLTDFQGNTTFRTDRPRQADKTFTGSWYNFKISDQLVNDFKKCCRKSGCTFFMGMVAILKLLIYREARTAFVTIGVTLSGRLSSEFENQIGNYINAVPLIVKVEDDMTFSGFLRQVRKTSLGALKHQLYPFDKIVNDLNIEKDKSRTPLCDVQVTWHTFGKSIESEELLSGIEKIEVDRTLNGVLFDLTLVGHEEGGNFTFDYNSDLYNRSTVEKIAEKMKQVMALTIEDSNQSLESIIADLADPEEVHEREEFLQSVAQSIDEDF